MAHFFFLRRNPRRVRRSLDRFRPGGMAIDRRGSWPRIGHGHGHGHGRVRDAPSVVYCLSPLSFRLRARSGAIRGESTPALRDHRQPLPLVSVPRRPAARGPRFLRGRVNPLESPSPYPRPAGRPHWPASRRSPSPGLAPRRSWGGTRPLVSMDTRSDTRESNGVRPAPKRRRRRRRWRRTRYGRDGSFCRRDSSPFCRT